MQVIVNLPSDRVLPLTISKASRPARKHTKPKQHGKPCSSSLYILRVKQHYSTLADRKMLEKTESINYGNAHQAISSATLSDMITKIIEDNGTLDDNALVNNDGFPMVLEKAYSENSLETLGDGTDANGAYGNGALSNQAINVTKPILGNPIGPAMAGRILLIPSFYNAEKVKDAVIGEKGRGHRRLLVWNRCNSIRFHECSILDGWSCFIAFSHATEHGARKTAIRIADLIVAAADGPSKRELRRKMKLRFCDPDIVAVGGPSFVLEEDIALVDVEDRQKGRALYEYAIARLPKKPQKSGMVILQRSPYDLETRIFMSLLEFPGTLRRRNACAAALIGTGGSVKKRIEDEVGCKLEIVLDSDTIGEPYVLVTSPTRDSVMKGVDSVIEIFKAVLSPLAGNSNQGTPNETTNAVSSSPSTEQV